MGVRVKEYLLFMFGDWDRIEKNVDVVNNIKDIMESIVIKEEFSFITGKDIIIMCIKSRMSFEEVDGLLKQFLTPYINTLFLMPKPRKLSYRLDENLENLLFGKTTKKYKTVDTKVAEILSQQLKNLMVDKVKKHNKNIDKHKKKHTINKTIFTPMTVDSLLDKIIDEGIGSLTEKETEFLNKFNT
jgi:hypothetical protein